MLAKSLSFLAGADAAGIVLGAKVPIILTSRADSVMTRLASCAVAALVAQARARERRARRSPGAAMTDAIARPQRRLVEHQVLALRRRRGDALALVARGQVEGLCTAPQFVAKDADGARRRREALGRRASARPRRRARRTSSTFLERTPARAPARRRSATASCTAALDYATPVRVDAERAATRSRSCVPLAPLHQPHNLAPIRALLERAPRAAAGRLLRHRVPPQPARRSRRCSRCPQSDHRARACAATAFTGCPTNTSRRVLPQLDARAAAGQDGRAAPRQRRQHVRAAGRRAASRARWASPRSTACRWARAAATSIPA